MFIVTNFFFTSIGRKIVLSDRPHPGCANNNNNTKHKLDMIDRKFVQKFDDDDVYTPQVLWSNIWFMSQIHLNIIEKWRRALANQFKLFFFYNELYFLPTFVK